MTLIRTYYDDTATKHYIYSDGSHTFKGANGFEYPYRALCDMITFHHDQYNKDGTLKRKSKLDGGASVSTYRGCNPTCKLLMKKTDFICSKCYTKGMEFPNLVNKLKENAKNLTQRELTDTEIKQAVYMLLAKGVKFFRFESMGDVINGLQVENYLRLARAINDLTDIPLATWTKNPCMWIKGFEKQGKPDRLKAVFSIPKINGADITPPSYILNWFDSIFIVCDPDYISENGLTVNCGGKWCKNCMTCYCTDKAITIEELK